MSLFEGSAPPDITKTTTTAVTSPQYLTDYLTKLASAGEGMLGKTGAELIAPQSDLTQAAYNVAPTALARYTTPLDSALAAGQAGATGVTAEDISGFYNPYQQDVIDAMARQSAQNVQRNVLPALRGAFSGSGAFGSQRYAGATGQALGDINAALQNEQAKLMAQGYTSALDAALKQKGLQTQAAQALTGLGTAEQQAATTGLKTGAELGAQQQAYQQAIIDAPLTRAQNVAQILRGYTYPTTATETYVGPGSIYQPSPLSQIAGLGSLVGAFTQGSGNNLIKDFMSQVPGYLSGWNFTPDISGTPSGDTTWT